MAVMDDHSRIEAEAIAHVWAGGEARTLSVEQALLA
jgi:hypothetical protein